MVGFNPHKREVYSYKYDSSLNPEWDVGSELFEDKSVRARPKRKNIDLVLGGNIAVEFKVEQMVTDRHSHEIFSGMTLEDAFHADLDKINFLDSKYKSKWVVIIVRSLPQIKELENIMRYTPNACWTFLRKDNFVAAIHEQSGECMGDLRKWKGGFLEHRVSPVLHAPKCHNREVEDFDSQPEESLLTLLKRFKDEFRHSIRDNKSWERQAQVYISKSIQCDAPGFSYGTKIRDINYPNPLNQDLKKKSVDFYFKSRGKQKRKYAMELKVEVGKSRKLSGMYGVGDALDEEIFKLQHWNPDDDTESRLVLLIVDSTHEKCREVMRWMYGRQGVGQGQADCPDDYREKWSTIDYIGSKDVRTHVNTVQNPKGFQYPLATVWALTTHEDYDGVGRPTPNDAMFLLVCIERVEGEACTQKYQHQEEEPAPDDFVETNAPTATMIPSASNRPSMMPSLSNAPSVSHAPSKTQMPSAAPSVSHSPSESHDPGHYQLINVQDSTLCMSVKDHDVNSDDPIVLAPCDKSKVSQLWIIDDEERISPLLNQYKCIDATETGGTDHPLELNDCDSGTYQQWEATAGNQLQNKLHSTQFISVSTGTPADGTRLELQTGSSTHQQWTRELLCSHQYCLIDHDRRCPSADILFSVSGGSRTDCYEECVGRGDCGYFSYGDGADVASGDQGLCTGCSNDAVLEEHDGVNSYTVLMAPSAMPSSKPTARPTPANTLMSKQEYREHVYSEMDLYDGLILR